MKSDSLNKYVKQIMKSQRMGQYMFLVHWA